MARVLMILPESHGQPAAGKTVSPPLGLLSLAAYAREKRPGRDRFILVDEGIEEKTDADWAETLARINPDVVAFSVITQQALRLARLVEICRQTVPEAVLVAGGPHITALGAAILHKMDLDYLVRGEGEIPFSRLLDALEGEGPPSLEKIPGTIFRQPDGKTFESKVPAPAADINRLPFPAWDLVDFDAYARLNRMTPSAFGNRYALLFTSRGCPYRCIYCHEIFTKKFRAQNPVRVVDEIEHLITRYGVHDFEIVDDVFNLDAKRVQAICREILRRGLETRFAFPNGVRTDILDEETLEALHSVGTYHMAFAVESASPRVQKQICKGLDLAKIPPNIALATKVGIFSWGFFMMGFPEETRREIWKTIFFATRSRLHGAYFFVAIPYPGTALSRKYVKDTEGALKTACEDGGLYYRSNISRLGPMELAATQALAHLVFFLYPPRVYRILRDFPNGWPVLASRFRLFLRLVFIRQIFGRVRNRFLKPKSAENL